MSAKDVVSFSGLEVHCIVGILPAERHKTQPLRVEARLTLDCSEAARTGEVALTADNAALAKASAYDHITGQFGLLESAAMTLLGLYLAPPPPTRKGTVVTEATVVITKPDALGGAGVPAVTLTRSRHDFKPQMGAHAGGLCETLYVGRDATLLRHTGPETGDAPWPGSRVLAGEMSQTDGTRLVLLRP